MNPRSAPAHASEAVVRATEHWESRRQARDSGGSAPQRPFTIALSRQMGSGGTSVALEIGQRLGWAVYDQELLKIIASELGLRENLVKSVDERHVSWLREFMSGLSLDPVLSESGYVQHLIQTIGSLGAHGECVIVGRGAPFILPAATTLRVRLVAPLENRVDYVTRTFKLSHSEAEKKVRELDRERENFAREYFRKDPADPVHYDVVINTGRYAVADTAELIVQALERLKARAGQR